MATRRIYVSDLHLSTMPAGHSLDPAYAWLKSNGRERFERFLEWLTSDCKRRPDTELVLLGDMLDTWVFPHSVVPPTVAEILGAAENAAIVQKLRTLGSLIRVFWMPGNHDMELCAQDLEGPIPTIRFGGSAGYDSIYVSGRVRAEHGSGHTLFNAPDPKMRKKLPAGYFISRLAASAVLRQGKAFKIPTIIDDILECIGGEDLVPAVVEAIAEEAGLAGHEKIVMPSHLWGGTSVSVDQVKDLYRDLYARWQQQKGRGLAFKALVAEIGWLADVADRLCKKGGPNVVVFGHSHDAELDKDTWFVDDRIYANCGAWIDETVEPGFVVVEKKPRGGDVGVDTHVTLFRWDAGGPKFESSECVPV